MLISAKYFKIPPLAWLPVRSGLPSCTCGQDLCCCQVPHSSLHHGLQSSHLEQLTADRPKGHNTVQYQTVESSLPHVVSAATGTLIGLGDNGMVALEGISPTIPEKLQ